MASSTDTLSPKRLPAPLHLRRACSISAGQGAKTFFLLLAKAGISAVIDTRLHRGYSHARFSDAQDLPYLCEAHGVRYAYHEELAPTARLREELQAGIRSADAVAKRGAWCAFLDGYADLIVRERKFLRAGSATRTAVDGPDEGIAFLCACQHPEDCHRLALLGCLSLFVEGVEVSHLTPDMVGGDPPSRASPRRYRVRGIPLAGLPPDGLPQKGGSRG